MATEAYWQWVRDGRKWTVAQPISDMVTYAKTAGVQWLGTLGSDDTRHLQADKPQDHTPFSVTAWPLPLPGYIVTACDLERGPWCERFLAECRAGVHPWVKYINFGGHHYSVKTDWVRGYSSDQHFHVSCRTDHLNARARNPFATEVNEVSGYGFVNPGDADALIWRVEALINGRETVLNGPAKGEVVQIVKMVNTLTAKVDAITSVAPADIETIKEALRDVLKNGVGS